MKKVSYTQMRAELSDILDALRNGEEVVVTQRGRPDTVLKATVNMQMQEEEATYFFAPFITVKGKKISPKNGGVFKIKTFDEALSRTKSKHSKIIKALEDK